VVAVPRALQRPAVCTALEPLPLGWAEGREACVNAMASPASLCLGPEPCRPGAGLSTEPSWDVARSGQGPWDGGGCKGRRAMVGRNPEGAIGIVMGRDPSSPECALPCAAPWQHGWGTMCGAVGLGRCRDRALKGATKELAGGLSNDRLQIRILWRRWRDGFSKGRAHLEVVLPRKFKSKEKSFCWS